MKKTLLGSIAAMAAIRKGCPTSEAPGMLTSRKARPHVPGRIESQPNRALFYPGLGEKDPRAK